CLIARWKGHGANRRGAAHVSGSAAVDRREHATDGFVVRALIDTVPEVFAGPDDVPFAIDEGGACGALQTVAVFRFELLSKIERLVAGWKQHEARLSPKCDQEREEEPGDENDPSLHDGHHALWAPGAGEEFVYSKAFGRED